MSKFREYYLIWFLIFGFMTIIGVLLNGSKIGYKFILLIITTSLVIPICLGRLIDWTHNIWTPRRRKKYYSQEPLINLLKLDFININDEYFRGTYNTYSVDIEYDHTMQRFLTYDFYYEPQSFGNEEFKRVHKLLKKYKVDSRAPGIISFSREIKFRIPKIENIEIELMEYSELLKEVSLKPITIEELDKLYKREEVNRNNKI